MSVCIRCKEEYYSVNYKNKFCPKCYDIELEKAVEALRKSWAERHSKD